MIITIIIVGMIIGTFDDHGISKLLYQQDNAFAAFFAAYGQLPFNLGFVVCGTMLLMIAKAERKDKFLYICAGLFLNLFGLGINTISPLNYLKELSLGVSFIISLLLCLGCVGLTLLYLKDADPQQMRRFVKFALSVLIGQLIVINAIKLFWGRPRMRMITVQEDAYFVPWYRWDRSLRTLLLSQGIPLEELKSFPSGHTAAASCILLYTLLPLVKNKDNVKIADRLLIIGLGYILIVAISRIIAGAHFVSDVTAGFAFCMLVIYLAYHKFYVLSGIDEKNYDDVIY